MDFVSFTIYLKILASRKEVKILIGGIITGGISQIVSKKYSQDHPELTTSSPRRRALNFLATKGFITGIITSTAILIIQIAIKKFIIVDGKKIYLDEVFSILQYVFNTVYKPGRVFKYLEK